MDPGTTAVRSQRGSHQVHWAPIVPLGNVSFNLKDSDTGGREAEARGLVLRKLGSFASLLSPASAAPLSSQLIQQQIQLGLRTACSWRASCCFCTISSFFKASSWDCWLLLEELSHSVHIPGQGIHVSVRCLWTAWVSHSTAGTGQSLSAAHSLHIRQSFLVWNATPTSLSCAGGRLCLHMAKPHPSCPKRTPTLVEVVQLWEGMRSRVTEEETGAGPPKMAGALQHAQEQPNSKGKPDLGEARI